MGILRKFIFLFSFSTALYFGIGGCGKPQVAEELPPEEFISLETVTADDFPLALIDSTNKVMASDLIRRLNRSNLLQSGGYLDSTTYFDTLQSIILDSIISLEAEYVDLRSNFDNYFTYIDRYRAFYLDYLYRRMILDKIEIDSAMVDSFYQAHPEIFFIPEQVHARHIMISSKGLLVGRDSAYYRGLLPEQVDSAAEALIREYYAMHQAGATVEELARQYSQHYESAPLGGDLGYFARGSFIKDFEDTVFSLDSGVVTEPFKSQDGWHIVELLDHTDSMTVKPEGKYYDMAYNHISGDIAKVMAMAITDSLYNAASYEFNDSALAIENFYQVRKDVWSVIVNGRDTLYHVKIPTLYEDYSRYAGKNKLTPDDKKEALKLISRQFLIIQAGDDLGYADDSAVVAERDMLNHFYKKAVIAKGGSDVDFNVTNSMVEAYYNENIDRFVIEKPLKVQHIIINDSLFGEYLRDQALSGINFLDLAREYYPGAEEIRVAAADLGYIGPDEMPPEFYDAAMATKVGGVSHPVKTELGYHIIKVIDKKFNKTLDQVKPQIVTELKNRHLVEYRQKWRDDLFAKHDIEYYLGKAKRIKLLGVKERMTPEPE